MKEAKRAQPFLRRFTPTRILAIGFFCAILLGTALLSLPAASGDGVSRGVADAAFTAVSATCVTGLSVVDTAAGWSLFGEIVILLLIQVGGLGFMSLSVIASMLLNRRITPQERIVLVQSFGLLSGGSVVKTVKRILIGTFSFELAGAAALAFRFVPLFGFVRGVYLSVFHSISAFCNAGFDLMGDVSGPFSSLSAFRGDLPVNLTVTFLIIAGGIGFIVWGELLPGRKHRLSSYTRLVLLVTALLIVGGTALTAYFEWNNPQTLGGLPAGEKLLASYFQAVSHRTAGFSTIPLAGIRTPTLFLFILLMLIGGSAGSAAGGVKTGTVGLLVAAALQTAMGNREITIFKRKVNKSVITRALSCFIMFLGLFLSAVFLLALSEGIPFGALCYEAASAIGTTGVSLGITNALTGFGRIVIMLLMYIGRLGIFTFAYATLLRSSNRDNLKSYPEENFPVG